MTLAELLLVWEATLRVRSKGTARVYTGHVRHFLRETDGDVTINAVAAWLGTLEELAPATRAAKVSAVKTFLRFAQAQGVLPTAPTDLLVRPHVEITSFMRYLNAEEIRAFMATARRLSLRHVAVCLGLYITAARVSELAGAKWRDLFTDPEGRLGLKLRRKGGRAGAVRVTPELFQVLAEVRGSSELDAGDVRPLIPSRRGTPLSVRRMEEIVAEVAKAAGITKKVSPHWLRHSHATLAASKKATGPAIQHQLGHAKLETSQRYIHWARGLEESTVDDLPDYR